MTTGKTEGRKHRQAQEDAPPVEERERMFLFIVCFNFFIRLFHFLFRDIRFILIIFLLLIARKRLLLLSSPEQFPEPVIAS